MKESLFGKTHDELIKICSDLALPGFTARQIAEWLYKHQVGDISMMTNLSKKARILLDESYIVGHQAFIDVQTSADGTRKYLFPSGEGKYIESALIPEKTRNTLCISSQTGCKMGCVFCMTGRQGFQGNLSPGQILNQLTGIPEKDEVSNLVYMGMGEPLDNTVNVIKSIQILTSEWGFAMSPRRITVSSIGILSSIPVLLAETDVHLAISLHTPFSDERIMLVPAEKANPTNEIMKIIRNFDWGRQRRISFEYIMFEGINDSDRHINELARLLNGLRTRVNLIRFHPIPGSDYRSSDERTILRFRDKLSEKGITTTVRASRGEDIMAACGLLSTMKSGEQD